jgi:hypothetical protein
LLADGRDSANWHSVAGHFNHVTSLGAGETLGKLDLEVPHGHPKSNYTFHAFPHDRKYFSALSPVLRRTIMQLNGLISTVRAASPDGGKLDSIDPAPREWVEPEGPMESFGFEDWPGVGVVYADFLAGTTSPRPPHQSSSPTTNHQPVRVAGVGCPMVASRARATQGATRPLPTRGPKGRSPPSRPWPFPSPAKSLLKNPNPSRQL